MLITLQQRTRWFLLFCVLGLALSPLFPTVSASPHPQTQPPTQLREGLVGQINKLNPLFANLNPIDRDITALIFEGLTTINQYGEVIPDLASDWTVSRDGLEYVFHLRQDVLWQDGIPFNANDVAFTIRTIRSRDFPGDPNLTSFWRTVEMDVLDEFTIRFRLVQPLASFPEHLQIGILPVHALENAPISTLDQHPFNLAPIGTGPYQIGNLLAEDGQIRGVTLNAAPVYRQRPEGQTGFALESIVFLTYPDYDAALAAFQAGEINTLSGLPADRVDEALANLANVDVHTAIAPGLGVLIYNWQNDELAYFRDQKMRRAFAYATDRAEAVRNALSGRVIPADSPIVPNSWAFNPAALYPAPNFEEAQRLVEQVSFEPPPAEETEAEEGTDPAATAEPTEPPAQIRRDFKIMVLDEPGIAGLAFEIAGQWSALGFGVSLDMVDAATFRSRLESGDFDVALVEFNLEGRADPDQFVLWHEGQYEIGQNYGGIQDRYISNLIAEARRELNGVTRKQLYDEFQRAFTSRVPAMVLYYPLYVYITDNRLAGVQLEFISSPASRFNTIAEWHFEAE